VANEALAFLRRILRSRRLLLGLTGAFALLFVAGLTGLAVSWLASRPEPPKPAAPSGLPATLAPATAASLTPKEPEPTAVPLQSSTSSCLSQPPKSLNPVGNVLNPSAYSEFPKSPSYDAGRVYGYTVGWPYIEVGGCLEIYTFQ
jgi:hypothetical protein